MNQGPVVYLPKKGPNATKSKKKKGKLGLTLDILVVLLVAGATFAMFRLTNVTTENQEKNNPDVIAEIKTEDDEEDQKEMDLNPVIKSWMSNDMRDSRQAVVVYDLDNKKIVGEISPDDVFQMESLYKLIVAYEGYRGLETGTLDGNEMIGEHTLKQCLDIMVRESDSVCAERVLEKIGEDNIDSVLKNQYGLEKTSIKELDTTAKDMAKYLGVLFEHKEIGKDSWAILSDSMLNQPKKHIEGICDGECDFRQGFARGFSSEAKVYEKVGWKYNGVHWDNFNEAGIVEFTKYKRSFGVVLLSELITESKTFVRLGETLNEAIPAYLELE